VRTEVLLLHSSLPTSGPVSIPRALSPSLVRSARRAQPAPAGCCFPGVCPASVLPHTLPLTSLPSAPAGWTRGSAVITRYVRSTFCARTLFRRPYTTVSTGGPDMVYAAIPGMDPRFRVVYRDDISPSSSLRSGGLQDRVFRTGTHPAWLGRWAPGGRVARTARYIGKDHSEPATVRGDAAPDRASIGADGIDGLMGVKSAAEFVYRDLGVRRGGREGGRQMGQWPALLARIADLRGRPK